MTDELPAVPVFVAGDWVNRQQMAGLSPPRNCNVSPGFGHRWTTPAEPAPAADRLLRSGRSMVGRRRNFLAGPTRNSFPVGHFSRIEIALANRYAVLYVYPAEQSVPTASGFGPEGVVHGVTRQRSQTGDVRAGGALPGGRHVGVRDAGRCGRARPPCVPELRPHLRV